MESLLQNIRVSSRSLRRHPGFAITAILTLALGIGLSTAVFTVADALLLRRLPVVDQDRIVLVSGRTSDNRTENVPLGFQDASDFAQRTRSLQSVALFGYQGAIQEPVRIGTQISHLRGSLVSGNFFSVLGTHAMLGRALRATDDLRGAALVVVLSHRAWEERFGGAHDVVGRRIQMLDGGTEYTIVGVMPQGLEYPRGTDMWAAIVPSTPENVLRLLAYNVIGRLAPGATQEQARDEMTAFFHRQDASATSRKLSGTVRTFPQLILGDTRLAVLVFVFASALLLLLTCVNVANLLLVRGLARVRDVAVRSALGASRRRVATQLLTEHAILAIAGCVLGLVIAVIAVRGFVAFAPPGLPRLDEIHLNVTVFAAGIVITVFAMLFFALAPAILTSRAELQQVLRSDSRQTASRRSRRITEGLVVGQLALAVIVLSGAALICRSLIKLEQAKLSFDPSHLLIGELALRYDEYNTAQKQLGLLERILPAIKAVPGVRAASPVVAPPFSGSGGWDGHPAAEGQSAQAAAVNPVVDMEVVTPDYFTTLGMSVLRGRGFTDQDRADAPLVTILSQSAARYYWPTEDPIGKRVTMDKHTLTVIGVVPDARYRDLRDARPSIYFPLKQSFFPFMPMTLAIRTDGSPNAAAPAIRRAVSEAVPGVELASVTPFDTFLGEQLAEPRLNALLLAVFAGTALALAAVGLFGVMTTMVHQRTHELGVRMALGATAASIGQLVLRRGMTLAVTGTLLGLLGALAANRLLRALLFEISPTDATTLGMVMLVLLAVAALASIIPARASARIEPVIALRTD